MGRDRHKHKPPAPTPGSVWFVEDPVGGGTTGLLVTEAGDLDRPLLYLDHSSGDTEKARGLANAVAHRPELLDQADTRADLRDAELHWFDLRQCGRPGSPLPVPSFLYGLECRPADGDLEALSRKPRPFCRFLLDELSDSARARYGLSLCVGEPAALRRLRHGSVSETDAAMSEARARQFTAAGVTAESVSFVVDGRTGAVQLQRDGTSWAYGSDDDPSTLFVYAKYGMTQLQVIDALAKVSQQVTRRWGEFSAGSIDLDGDGCLVLSRGDVSQKESGSPAFTNDPSRGSKVIAGGAPTAA